MPLQCTSMLCMTTFLVSLFCSFQMKFINIIMLIIWEIFLHSFLATFKVKNAGSMDICDDPKKKENKTEFCLKTWHRSNQTFCNMLFLNCQGNRRNSVLIIVALKVSVILYLLNMKPNVAEIGHCNPNITWSGSKRL